MSVKITDIAVMHDTKEIIAVGTGFCALLDNADAAGVWDKKPGSGAPYFCTSAESKEFFGAWYREGFWADHNPDGTAIVRPKAEIEYERSRTGETGGCIMENDLIGEFISIPAWKTFGVVIGQEPITTGSDGAVRVRVQDRPDRPDLARWYNLEPGEFEVDG